MRWLLRLLLFWAISGPLFYLFGVPFLLDMLSKKAQTQGYSQCIALMTDEKRIGSPNSPLTQAQGERYCHCASDGLLFAKSDLFDMLQKKQPAALNALGQTLSDTCNRQLQQSLGFLPAD
jgi:hypothetical protein